MTSSSAVRAWMSSPAPARNLDRHAPSALAIRARHRAATMRRQFGRHRADALTGDAVIVAGEVFVLGIGRTEYPPPPFLFDRDGAIVAPAYPYGMPDA